ncbi:hypothetical protein AA313_de0200281 [Arthrobotrys entomopaga]|nr:hypothetical protein AA313_de0200281 [Arthrobotrys entomopaga]
MGLKRTVLWSLSSPFLLRQAVSAQEAIPQSESYTIESALSYNYLRTCGYCCLGIGLCYPGERLTNVVACTLNSCLCRRADISTSALNYISSCVNSACSADKDDISQYQQVFENYCSAYLGDIPSQTDAATTGDSGITNNVTPAAPASTVTETERTTIIQSNQSLTSVATIASTLPNSVLTSFTSVQTVLVTTVTATPPQNANSTNKIALGIGLGVGIPLLVAVIVIGALLLRRRSYVNPIIVGGNQDQMHHPGQASIALNQKTYGG